MKNLMSIKYVIYHSETVLSILFSLQALPLGLILSLVNVEIEQCSVFMKCAAESADALWTIYDNENIP